MQSMFFANSLHVFQTAQLWGSPQVHALPVLCLRLVVQVSSCLKEMNASCDRWHMIPRELQLGEGIKMTILHLWSERNDAATCAWPNFPASAPLRILTLLRHLARDTGIGLGRRFHWIFQKFFRSAKSFTVIQSPRSLPLISESSGWSHCWRVPNFNVRPCWASIQRHDKEGMSARLWSLGVKHTDKLQGHVCRGCSESFQRAGRKRCQTRESTLIIRYHPSKTTKK